MGKNKKNKASKNNKKQQKKKENPGFRKEEVQENVSEGKISAFIANTGQKFKKFFMGNGQSYSPYEYFYENHSNNSKYRSYPEENEYFIFI